MASSPDIPRDQNLFQTIRDLKKPRTRTDDGWIRVGSTSDEIAPDFENSWAWQGGDTVPVEFYLAPDGEVRMHGALNDGPDIPSVVFTLPEGYRPQYSERFVGALSVGADTAKIQVDPDGSVWIVSVGYAPGAGTVNPNVLDLTGGAEGDTLTIVSGTAVWQANPAPSPASIVVASTSFGQSSAVGTNTTYARSDHVHGTPTNPVPAHVADSDPHTQYQLKSLKGAANGYASLNGSTLIPSTQMGTGTASSSTILFGDGVWRSVGVITGGVGAAASVVASTSFGQSSAVGTSGNYAREDHVHGTPADPIPAHVAAGDPHTQYQKESEKDAANGYAGLNSGGFVPIARLASGTPDGTKFVRDDGTLAVPAGGGGGGGGSPATSVVSGTAFGHSPDVGSSLLYARADHDHGTPTDPIPAHVADTDPHPQYIMNDLIGALGGVAPLDGTTGLVPPSLLGIGTADVNHYLRGDGVWDSLSSLGGGTGGSVWLTGSGDPDPLDGGNGDMYLRDDGQVFNKVSGSWVDTGINLSAGGAGKQVMMQWAGKVEQITTFFPWRAPYVGSSGKTYSLERAFARVETPGATSTVIVVEKSNGGGAFVVASTLATITVAAGDYELDNDSITGTFHSGDLLRARVTTQGTTGQFQIDLQAIESGPYP